MGAAREEVVVVSQAEEGFSTGFGSRLIVRLLGKRGSLGAVTARGGVRPGLLHG